MQPVCTDERGVALWIEGAESTGIWVCWSLMHVAYLVVLIKEIQLILLSEWMKIELLPIDTDFDHFAWVVLVLWKEKQEEKCQRIILPV